MFDQLSTAQTLNHMIVGSWTTQAIYVAAELAIADFLAEGPRTVAELAEQTHTDEDALHRVLRALASVGIFAEDGRGRFSLTRLAEKLRSDTPASLRSLAIMAGAEIYQSWGNLLSSVQTGVATFQKAFGAPFFQYMTERPERGRIYDAAMAEVRSAETEAALDAYDFSPLETVVDVGGGNGTQLASILRRYPKMQGILFDLPAVAKRTETLLQDGAVSDRCRIVGGDFFSSAPAGGDGYVLRHVIHDWQDDEAAVILRNCRDAMNPGGRILVLETVIRPGNEPSFGKWLDLMMLIVGGRERTVDEYTRLFSSAGLRLNRVVPTATELTWLEGVRETRGGGS